MQVPQDIDMLLRAAISQRRQIRFWYRGKERIAEPHDYGIQNGAVRLLAFQIGGESGSGHLPAWRLIDVSGVTGLEILDRTFAGNRPAPSGKHHNWDQLWLRVDGK
jgi:WYL domain